MRDFADLRPTAPDITLARAKALAARAGLVSVRDITALSGLGLPVFASERPEALGDHFAFGKGLRAIDAEIGALMEALEFHWAEPGRAPIETRWGKASDLPHPLAEFAARTDVDVRGSEKLLLARAQNIETGAEAWLPAELVFFPAPETAATFFGSSSNGLASGNTVLEASFFALLELMERDIWSLEFVRDSSLLVTALPLEFEALQARAIKSGLRLLARTVPNDYGIPFFTAFLFDPERPQTHLFNGGWGCRPGKIAALRQAVCEVAQSRAAYLDGARRCEERGHDLDAQIEAVVRPEPAVTFAAIADLPFTGGLEEQWTQLRACLNRVVARPIYRVVYTDEDCPLQAVRLIVPLLEHFTPQTMRAGPRLIALLEADGA
ncbi:MAG: YcaO-like family protein [Alphaproteobacteria bacterium]|nr:YcaO-like family protein [Alphaproteobacteria bacterium]MBV9694165.1 YcaO-like family protein [Alphaproteobacteria bacterium]